MASQGFSVVGVPKPPHAGGRRQVQLYRGREPRHLRPVQLRQENVGGDGENAGRCLAHAKMVSPALLLTGSRLLRPWMCKTVRGSQ